MPQTVQFKAEDARLITRLSSDRAGLGDLVVKRDFRTDLDQIIRREGYDYFWPNTDGDLVSNPGNQPFPNAPNTDEAITLVHLARRPNGSHAILVGTKTKLWRFFALENGEYFDGTGSSAYFENDNETPENANAYFLNANGDWLEIGSGFSPDGARWEAVDINGYTVLNNGVDLPMTYRIEESEVVPIYELREQGISAVGTIGESNGILVCGDISEITSEALTTLMSPVGDIDGGNMTAQQSGTTVTTPADFFTDGTNGTVDHKGRTIAWADGTSAKIQNVDGLRQVTVDTSATVSAQRFTLRNKATQAGATFSGLVTAGNSGTTVSTAGSDFFNVGMVGKTIRFSNGFSSVIDAYLDTRHITIHDTPPEPIVTLPFWITDDSAKVLVADSPAFDASMVGRFIVFDTGEIRQIQGYTDSKTVTVDVDGAIASTLFRIENTSSYSAFADLANVNRIRYRTIWSMPDEPRRFGSIIPGTMAVGEQTVELDFPGKSFESGQEVIVVGAGVNGGNITATILAITELGRKLLLSETAETAITSQAVEQSDAFGSIVGYEDLQDDSSAILRILALGDVLVIYKETCIFTAFFTGDTSNPWDFKRLKMPKGIALVYRWTLVDIGGQFHLYAGANNFYKFDLASRIPDIIPEMEMISDIFFSQASLTQTDSIYAADNTVTNEVFFFFPSATSEKGIAFDYKQISTSTTAMQMTAAATVKRPVVGSGGSEDLFLMGNSEGTVLVYGRADTAQSNWADAKEIFYRRSAYPFGETKGAYESVLKSGMGDFGRPHSEKDLSNYVLYLASQSPDCEITLTLYGARNSSEPADTLLNYFIADPERENLVPMFYRAHYFQTQLIVSGIDDPCRVAMQTFDVEEVVSQSHERRVT